MNYIAITEISPLIFHSETEVKDFDTETFKKLLSEVAILPITSKTEPLKAFTTIKLTEDTFKFIESVATIEVPTYGERNYIINNLSFNIYSEEDYEIKFGKLEE